MSYYKSYLDKKNNLKPETVAPTDPATPPVTITPAKTNPHSKIKVNPWMLSALITVIAVTVSAGMFYQFYSAQKKINDTVLGTSTDAQNKQLINEVGKLFLFPKGETPTVALVTNVEKLRATQPFFNSAQNGDKLLIFSQKAILYRPSENKIIDIGPVNNQSTTAGTQTPTPTVTTTPTPIVTPMQTQIPTFTPIP